LRSDGELVIEGLPIHVVFSKLVNEQEGKIGLFRVLYSYDTVLVVAVAQLKWE
jgi:hypothetical protein